MTYHIQRDYIANETVRLEYFPTSPMAADGFTKSLDGQKLLAFRNMIQLVSEEGNFAYIACRQRSRCGGVLGYESKLQSGKGVRNLIGKG